VVADLGFHSRTITLQPRQALMELSALTQVVKQASQHCYVQCDDDAEGYFH
jgi:hypothetical protein